MPQSQAASRPRHQEEEETDKIQRSTIRTNVQKALRSALSSPSEVIVMLKGKQTKKTKQKEKQQQHKNKITQGKTQNKSPRRINHKATKSKNNTRTTALKRAVE